MNKKIYFYRLNGTLEKVGDFNEDNLKSILGMKVKCIFNDETEEIGYVDYSDDFSINSIQLWTLKDFDSKHPYDVYDQIFKKVDLTKVKTILAIICSNPRWGTVPSNEFELDKKTYSYVYVEYLDSIGEKLYCYRTNINDLKKGDYVLVERCNEEVYGKVITIKEYALKDLPYPLEKIKFIIKKANVIFSYSLKDAWYKDLASIVIIDEKENNILVSNNFLEEFFIQTISDDDITKIKDIINNEELLNIDVLPPTPVWDGTFHVFNIGNKYNIRTNNLWYWLKEENVEKQVKILLSVVNDINNILQKYSLDINLGEDIL